MRSRRGVALMLVLWLVVVLGTIATGVASATRRETDKVVNLRARAVARSAAESGVVAAVSRLTAIVAASRTPTEQARVFRDLENSLADLREVSLGSSRFGVTVVDLNARIDLNNADDLTLMGFFQQFVGARQAEALMSALQDWKDRDDRPRPGSAEASDYARAGSAFRPSNHPLRRLDELTRIAGFTDSLADAIAPYVTIHGDGRININTAPERVLASIPRLGPAGARTVVSWREGGEGGEVFASLADIYSAFQRGGMSQSIMLSTLVTVPSRLLIVSRGWGGEPGHSLTHEVQAVYELTGARFILREWKERDL